MYSNHGIKLVNLLVTMGRRIVERNPILTIIPYFRSFISPYTVALLSHIALLLRCIRPRCLR